MERERLVRILGQAQVPNSRPKALMGKIFCQISLGERLRVWGPSLHKLVEVEVEASRDDLQGKVEFLP